MNIGVPVCDSCACDNADDPNAVLCMGSIAMVCTIGMCVVLIESIRSSIEGSTQVSCVSEL
jgi:hypothetical protein